MGVCGISPAFAGLSHTPGQVPTRYSPVRHSSIARGVRLACVRHAASVRSEPGSNSQLSLEARLAKKPSPFPAPLDRHPRNRLSKDAQTNSASQRRRPRIPSSSHHVKDHHPKTKPPLIGSPPSQVNSLSAAREPGRTLKGPFMEERDRVSRRC
jgi:hypothetical protein